MKSYGTQRGGTSQDPSHTLISLCASETDKGTISSLLPEGAPQANFFQGNLVLPAVLMT